MKYISGITRLLYGFNDRANAILCIYISRYTDSTGEEILVTKPVDSPESTIIAPESMFQRESLSEGFSED